MAGRTTSVLCVILLFAVCRTHAQRFSITGILRPAALLVTTTASPLSVSDVTNSTASHDATTSPRSRTGSHVMTSPRSTFTRHVTHPHRIRCGKYLCNCVGNQALCIGDDRRRYHYIPQLPSNIVYFRLMRSQLPNLTRVMMSNLTNFDLTGVNLTNNHIRVIAPDAFADLHKLELLDLSYNPLLSLNSVHASLAGLPSTTMKTLSLAANNIQALPDDFFAVFTGSNFTKLDLQQNFLTVFSSALFAPFGVLETLELRHNRLGEVNMTSQAYVRKLVLEGNVFPQFPDLCLHRSPTTGEPGLFSAFIRLRSLYVHNNQFSGIDPQVLRGACYPHLLKIDMRQSWRLTTIKDNVFADLPRLEVLMMSQMQSLKSIQSKAFNSSSLKSLDMKQNSRMSHKQLANISETFLYTTALEQLSITDTVMDMNWHELRLLFQPLTSLVRLTLDNVRTASLPPGVLASFPNLQYLQFTGNAMPAGQLKKTLQGVTSLSELNVQGNNINVLFEDTLSPELRNNLTRIDLSLNPFACNCELRWFRRWLDDVHKNRKVKVTNWPNDRQYTCATPVSLKRSPLVKFNPTDLECALYAILGITGGVILASLLLTSLLIYRYRWHLRFCLYRIRRRRQYKKIDGEDRNIPLYRYDAYLAHSPCDVDWIVAELLPLLEGQHELNVFLEERDEVPGSVKADNYERNMDLSARVVLVISNNYLADSWREWEFQHVLYASIEQQKDVIVVLLNDVEPGRMTHDMRRMLTRGTFLQWGDSQEARDTFREGLTVALKTKNISMEPSC